MKGPGGTKEEEEIFLVKEVPVKIGEGPETFEFSIPKDVALRGQFYMCMKLEMVSQTHGSLAKCV